MAEKSDIVTKISPSFSDDKVVEVGEGAVVVDSRPPHLKRELEGKQVQLFAIGAAIGTGVFVSMGSYLPTGGPAGLFLGFLAWAIVVYGVNECYGKTSPHAWCRIRGADSKCRRDGLLRACTCAFHSLCRRLGR